MAARDDATTILDAVETSSPSPTDDRRAKIGVVQTVWITGAPASCTILFDGETVVGGKQYPCVSTYNPGTGDRVVVIPVGSATSWLVVGAIGPGDGSGSYYAPPPSGGDDTAILQALFDAAANGRGEVILGHGDYYTTGISLVQQFKQPLIRGRGKDYTRIIHTNSSGGPVIRFRGGSGALSGGGLRDLTVVGNTLYTSTGVEFSGCGHVIARDICVTRCGTAVMFHNAEGSDFTEFCEIQDSSVDDCSRFLYYKVDNGVESFHGAGARGNNIVNLKTGSTSSAVEIGGIAVPYNAPMSFDIFPQPATHLFNADDTGRPAGRHSSFYGTIKVEGRNSTDWEPIAVTQGSRILYAGKIIYFGATKVTLGALFLCTKIWYDGSTVAGELLPVTYSAQLKASPTVVAAVGGFEQGSITLMAVNVQGPNYEYHALVTVQRSAFDGTVAFINELQRTQYLDSGGKGLPAFTFGASGLFISNSNYTTDFAAYVTLTSMGGSSAHNVVSQARLG